ncbi:exodeoxyribonuclease VII large subunit [Nonomuraea cavernae]|uniref:Exodeoxyribonuclease 7 large subunit n=1 Tax=Nonomuraea cavernae TaxID=2045107 RepID=A0A917YVB0_9ACTN|nr:exodeoxyribonuclease VII large subunit [Nonomuraea cavernae]MCA2186766.1 exodeoxyribonuclease VII large subunit [Nonomuraea cavernae]GGO67659.1 exodeoxyribonuclease 7 large subunit [Nonomuraea cavernae]
MTSKTSPESPLPIRTVLQMVGGWIGKLGTVWVEGQITDLTARGGTVFLTLRDPVANVSARVTAPRGVYEAALPRPADGARVVVHVKPDFWINKGSFAFTALEIRPVGVGELLARLERLRRLLAAEGLFNTDRKRRLPFLPGTVGLICGRDSAAERDVLENSRRRWPAVRFKVEEVAVQGPYAVGEVTEALRKLDADSSIDVIVIARGGGSLEDLLPFSDETLVRAVAACRTPVVSAIGHEQDGPLLDLVADVRASTPTDAAKKVVPDVGEQLTLVRQLRDRGRRVVGGWLDRETSWLTSVRSRPSLADPVRELERRAEQAEALRDRARRSLAGSLDRAEDSLSHLRARLVALSPAATLERGYAIVQHPSGDVVRLAKDVSPGALLTIRLTDDRLTVRAEAPGGDDTPAAKPRKPRKKPADPA